VNIRLRWVLLVLLLIVLVPLTGCGSSKVDTEVDTEREAIIAFTGEALQIEAQRAELMEYFVDVDTRYGRLVQNFVMAEAFSGGVLPPYELSGFNTLHPLVMALDSPQPMQIIKESLIYIYKTEWEEFEKGKTKWRESLKGKEEDYLWEFGVYPDVTMDNLDYLKQEAAKPYSPDSGEGLLEHSYFQHKVDNEWYKLQSFRRDVYTQWAQILKDNGIDPAKEGLTDLAPR